MSQRTRTKPKRWSAIGGMVWNGTEWDKDRPWMLNTFARVAVGLDDPYVRVRITVTPLGKVSKRRKRI